MSEKITTDETKDEIRNIVCNLCDNTTNHTVCSSVKSTWGNDDIQGYDKYEMVRCLGCDSVSLRITSGNSDDFDHDNEGHIIYNEAEEIYPSRLMGRVALKDIYSLPEDVRVTYKETHSALCGKLKKLSGIGIRLLIEAVCLEEEAKGSNLKKKIDDLVVKNVLTKKNAEVLHRTRLLGNDTAHKRKVPSDSELDVAFDIVENLLETVYIIPKKAERLK